MAISYFPIIRREEFEAFRDRMSGDVPNTYPEWENCIDNEMVKAGGQGFEVVPVKVNFDKWVEWLATHGGENTSHGLKNFATFVANPE